MSNSHLIVAVDIGSSKVCAIAGSEDEPGEGVNIEAFAERSFKFNEEGVSNGKINNLEKTAILLDEVLAEIAEIANCQVRSVNLSISSEEIEGSVYKTTITRGDQGTTVQEHDLDNLLNDVKRSFKPRPGHVLLHTLPQFFNVDNRTVSDDPIGHVGLRLGGAFYAVTTPLENIKYLYETVAQVPAKAAGGSDTRDTVSIDATLFSPIPDSLALLQHRDKEGVAIVNIGSDITELSIFFRQGIRYASVIPIAGKNITQDIADQYNLSFEDAEMLKITCGAVPPTELKENDVFVVSGGDGIPDSEIPAQGVLHIIEARLKEITAIVVAEIMKEGYEGKLNKGIILTGGGSNLFIAKDLFADISNLHTRRGNPLKNIRKNSYSQLENPSYSTVVGLLLSSFVSFDDRVPPSVLEPDTSSLVKVAPVKVKKEKANVSSFINRVKGFFRDDNEGDAY